MIGLPQRADRRAAAGGACPAATVALPAAETVTSLAMPSAHRLAASDHER
ncbi:hypothetical protein [Actinoplanes sp. NPDC026670]